MEEAWRGWSQGPIPSDGRSGAPGFLRSLPRVCDGGAFSRFPAGQDDFCVRARDIIGNYLACHSERSEESPACRKAEILHSVQNDKKGQ